MAHKVWRFELDEGWHLVELRHRQGWGVRRVILDGQTVVNDTVPLDGSERYQLRVNAHTVTVSIVFISPWKFNYQLLIDDEPVPDSSAAASLLRASGPPLKSTSMLLRPAAKVTDHGSDELLRGDKGLPTNDD